MYKRQIVYKAGAAATPASSTIVDLPLPPGVVIDVSSIALTHDGVGAGTYSLNIQVLDKAGNAKYSGTEMLSAKRFFQAHAGVKKERKIP